ncbi:hypothetical protein ABZ848_28165 [Streptomyces sp. NPDC047081]|uniref:hypothetical protein n=1 Tax=Streptomyces sp. NPDC047081 TaxID=3154706 RepID=UPI0033CC4DED
MKAAVDIAVAFVLGGMNVERRQADDERGLGAGEKQPPQVLVRGQGEAGRQVPRSTMG